MRPAEAAELKLRSILETDRAWTAYALADLFPPWSAYAEWIAGDRSALLIYRGLAPPILLAHGNPGELDSLMAQLPPGEYWYTLRPTDYSRLGPRLQTHDRTRMWRMWLPAEAQSGVAEEVLDPKRPGQHPPISKPIAGNAELEQAAMESNSDRLIGQLGPQHLPELEQLYAELPDGPDAFTPAQLEHGVYFGWREGGELLSVAGTHVVCPQVGVAALGNIATRPEQRGRGLGSRVCLAVVRELRRQNCGTIVLNVRMDNQPAIRLYRKLGFMPFCGFYEGRGSLH